MRSAISFRSCMPIPVTTACPVRIGDDTGDDASAWWRMAHVTHAIRMHGERATTVPPSIPCVACTYASLGSMALPVSARPAVSFPTGIGRPRIAMYFPIPTGKGTPITDPGRWNRTRCMMVGSRYPCTQPSTQHPCDRTRWGRDIVAGADRGYLTSAPRCLVRERIGSFGPDDWGLLVLCPSRLSSRWSTRRGVPPIRSIR